MGGSTAKVQSKVRADPTSKADPKLMATVESILMAVLIAMAGSRSKAN